MIEHTDWLAAEKLSLPRDVSCEAMSLSVDSCPASARGPFFDVPLWDEESDEERQEADSEVQHFIELLSEKLKLDLSCYNDEVYSSIEEHVLFYFEVEDKERPTPLEIPTAAQLTVDYCKLQAKDCEKSLSKVIDFLYDVRCELQDLHQEDLARHKIDLADALELEDQKLVAKKERLHLCRKQVMKAHACMERVLQHGFKDDRCALRRQAFALNAAIWCQTITDKYAQQSNSLVIEELDHEVYKAEVQRKYNDDVERLQKKHTTIIDELECVCSLTLHFKRAIVDGYEQVAKHLRKMANRSAKDEPSDE